MHISVVSPVFRAEGCVEELCRRVLLVLDEIHVDHEVVLVDDCSPDGSWAVIERLAAAEPRIRGVRLTRNFGQHNAVTAGLEQSRGEWVVVMDCDLQDRPEAIPHLYGKAMEGNECVMGRRARPRSFSWRRLQSWLFYRVFSYLTDIPYDGAVTNFSIISRRIANEILAMKESVRYFPGFLFWLGFAKVFVDVPHDPRFCGTSSYTLSRLLRHSKNIILAYSTKPLVLCMKVGFFISMMSFLAGCGYLIWTLVHGTGVEGWPSLIISLYFTTGSIIFALGMVGMYAGSIFNETKRRPHYVVAKRTFHD